MADDVWKRLGRRVTSAKERAVRQPDEHGWRAGASIRELTALRDLLDDLIDAEVIRGREQGAEWVLLGSSKQQAQQRYRRATRSRTAPVNNV